MAALKYYGLLCIRTTNTRPFHPTRRRRRASAYSLPTLHYKLCVRDPSGNGQCLSIRNPIFRSRLEKVICHRTGGLRPAAARCNGGRSRLATVRETVVGFLVFEKANGRSRNIVSIHFSHSFHYTNILILFSIFNP